MRCSHSTRSLGTFSRQDCNAEEDVNLKEVVFVVGISRMAGCVYRLLRHQTSTSTQSI